MWFLLRLNILLIDVTYPVINLFLWKHASYNKHFITWTHTLVNRRLTDIFVRLFKMDGRHFNIPLYETNVFLQCVLFWMTVDTWCHVTCSRSKRGDVEASEGVNKYCSSFVPVRSLSWRLDFTLCLFCLARDDLFVLVQLRCCSCLSDR